MASEKSQLPPPPFRASPGDTEEDLDGSPLSTPSIVEAVDTDDELPAYQGHSGVRTSTGKSSTTIPTQSSSQSSQSQLHTQKPIAIPAVDSSFDSPFIRAYPPVLKGYKLPQEVFLSFLERLNKAIASSPPLQVLDVTGGILNSVPILFPLHWIGTAVSGLASLSNAGVSKNRTDTLLRDANRDIFGPRGLKIEIAKLDALAHIANIPILDSHGKVSRQTPLFQQLSPVDDLSSYSDETRAVTFDEQKRRLQLLQPWIADLEFEDTLWDSKSRLTRFNDALRRHNGVDSNGVPRKYAHGSYGSHPFEPNQTKSNTYDTYNTYQVQPDDNPFQKSLWLVLREL